MRPARALVLPNISTPTILDIGNMYRDIAPQSAQGKENVILELISLVFQVEERTIISVSSYAPCLLILQVSSSYFCLRTFGNLAEIHIIPFENEPKGVF